VSSKITRIWKIVLVKREKLATVFLMLGTFFNPMGYDALLKWLLDKTGNYWLSISIFYLVSAVCFIFYFILSKTNPLKMFKKNKIVYIGKTNTLRSRLFSINTTKKNWKIDSFTFSENLTYGNIEMHSLEMENIRHYKPSFNKVGNYSAKEHRERYDTSKTIHKPKLQALLSPLT